MDAIEAGFKVLWAAPKDFSPSGGLFWFLCLVLLGSVYGACFALWERRRLGVGA